MPPIASSAASDAELTKSRIKRSVEPEPKHITRLIERNSKATSEPIAQLTRARASESFQFSLLKSEDSATLSDRASIAQRTVRNFSPLLESVVAVIALRIRSQFAFVSAMRKLSLEIVRKLELVAPPIRKESERKKEHIAPRIENSTERKIEDMSLAIERDSELKPRRGGTQIETNFTLTTKHLVSVIVRDG
jgi:hypothetical protein